MEDSIVFIDEGNSFVNSQVFAQTIMGTSNYYVLITRESLYQLSYSVESVLELRKTNSISKRTYNKAYPYYKTLTALIGAVGLSEKSLAVRTAGRCKIRVFPASPFVSHKPFETSPKSALSLGPCLFPPLLAVHSGSPK